eukprot:g82058.t1
MKALLVVQLSVSASCLCALCVLFFWCWLDLERHRNRPGRWVARVHKFRQLLIGACIPTCILLLATTLWNSRVSSYSTESVVCTRLTRATYFTANLSTFFLVCFLYARLHTVGLFHPAEAKPSSQLEGCLLRNVDRVMFACLSLYFMAPFACFYLYGEFDMIGEVLVCVPAPPFWVVLPSFIFDFLFGLVLVGGFSFQIHRLSKLPPIRQGADSRRTFERMLRRTLQAGVVTLGTSVTMMLLAFPATRYYSFYYLFPLSQTIDSFMTYYCTTNRAVVTPVTELASLSHLHLSEDSLMKMKPPPGVSTVTVSTRASVSYNMLTMISSTASQTRNWFALKLKVFGLTRISEGSEKTDGTHPQVSNLDSNERSMKMSKAVLIIPPSQTEVVQNAVNSLAVKEGVLEPEGWRTAKTVEVFQANSRAELKRALTHETASQLGCPATDGNTQIMQRTHQSPTAASVPPEDNFTASARAQRFGVEEDDFLTKLQRTGIWHIEDLRMVDIVPLPTPAQPEDNFTASARAQRFGSEENHRNQQWHLTAGPVVEPPLPVDSAGVEEDDFLTKLQRTGICDIEDLRMVDIVPLPTPAQ